MVPPDWQRVGVPKLRSLALGLCAVVLVAGCGTTGVSLRDEEQAAAAPASSTSTTTTTTTVGPASSRVVTTTTSTTTTTTTTSTTTSTTTTTTIPPAEMQFDDEGVPLNGQTSGVVVTPTGWITPAFGPSEGGGWRIWSPCGVETVIDDGEFIDTVDIVLDPGHGGSEPGAVGPNGLIEADLNLAVAERAATGLRAAGFSVVMTRDEDARVPIVTRGEIALALDPIAFISIHHNAGTDAPSSSPGTEVFHQIEDSESRRLAGLLLEEARSALAPYDVDWVSMGDAGAMVRPNREGGDYYGVLRRPAGVTSILAEFAYLSNAPEADLLTRTDVQEALAEAVVDAVVRLTTTEDPGSGYTEDPIFRGYGPSGAGGTVDCVDPPLQ